MTPKPNDSERMRELGRASGRARRERRKRSFLDVLTSHVNENPEELVGALMNSPAGAVVVARIAEKSGALEREQAPAAESVFMSAGPAAGAHTLRDLLVTAARTNSEHLIFGITLSDEQKRELLVDVVDVEGGGAGESGTPVPSKPPVSSSRSRARGSERPGSPPNAPRGTNTRSDPPPPQDGLGPPPDTRRGGPSPEQVYAPDILAAFLVAERKELGLEPDDGNDDREIQAPKEGRFQRL